MAEQDPYANIFSQKNSRLADDTVFFSIYPDFTLNPTSPPTSITSQLQSLHLQILQNLSPFTSNYIWQHEPFTLTLSPGPTPPHLSGKLRYGDNLEDEWFVVFLLFETSKRFPSVSIRVWDSDGEFLLIETAFYLPRWVNPDTAMNRVFIRGGFLHIIPNSVIPTTPSIHEALNLLRNVSSTRAPEGVQRQLENRLKEYPNRAEKMCTRLGLGFPCQLQKC